MTEIRWSHREERKQEGGSPGEEDMARTKEEI